MMSNDRSSGQGGLFPGIGGQYGAGAGMGQLSPYLNIDPSYLNQSQPEYLFNTETKRGNFEKSFSAIGSSVIVGSAVGGTFGFFDGRITFFVFNKYIILGIRAAIATLFLGCASHSLLHFHSF